MNLCEAWPKMESGGEWRGDGCGGGVVYSRRENRLVWKGGNARWNDTNCPLCELLRWDWQPVPAEVKPDLAEDNRRLREALEYYANAQSTVRDCVAGGSCANVDMCETAINALAISPCTPEPDFTGDLTPGQATCAMEAGLCVQNRDVCLRIKSKCVQVYGAHRGWYDADDRWTHRQIMRGSYRVVPDPEAAEEAEREPITLLEPVTVKRGGRARLVYKKRLASTTCGNSSVPSKPSG